MLNRLKRSLKGSLRTFVDQRIELRLAEEAPPVEQPLRDELAMPARILPADPDNPVRIWPMATPSEATTPEGFPLPPVELQERAFDFHELGQEHTNNVRKALDRAGASSTGNILDFGCATGRITRWFLEEAREHQVWGVDINAQHIAWNQAHLSPPFHFSLCSTFPSLPFEDDYFGLTFAGSVFTHISEMEDAWLLELRRVTAPGGFLYLTIQDASFIDNMVEHYRTTWLGEMIVENLDTLDQLGDTAETISVGRRGYNAMVFHDREALVRRWSAHLEVIEVIDQALYQQSAVVLRKRPR